MSRRATDAEVAAWKLHGWSLLPGLIGPEEIDAARADLWRLFPSPESFHADPAGETRLRLGSPPEASSEGYQWPAQAPAFRPEQHRWQRPFPFPGSGMLNRLCVHASVLDCVRRMFEADEIRIYQARAVAKYAGVTNYEQPLHVDRNHSWLAPEPQGQLQAFLYLSDVTDETGATRLVSNLDALGRSRQVTMILPRADPELYEREVSAAGPQGSLLVYRNDVFHRASNLVAAEGARFVLSLAYRLADHEWIGYDAFQPDATEYAWITFVEQSSPDELAAFGFPAPGHPIWNEERLQETALRYPRLDLEPWLAATRRRVNGPFSTCVERPGGVVAMPSELDPLDTADGPEQRRLSASGFTGELP